MLDGVHSIVAEPRCYKRDKWIVWNRLVRDPIYIHPLWICGSHNTNRLLKWSDLDWVCVCGFFFFYYGLFYSDTNLAQPGGMFLGSKAN